MSLRRKNGNKRVSTDGIKSFFFHFLKRILPRSRENSYLLDLYPRSRIKIDSEGYVMVTQGGLNSEALSSLTRAGLLHHSVTQFL